MHRTAPVAAMLVVILTGCGGNDTADTSAATTPPVLPPTTYVAFWTGPFTGTVADAGGLSGTIDFRVIDVGTGATYAEGQVVDADYQVIDLQVSVTLDGYDCGGSSTDGEASLVLAGPFPLRTFDLSAGDPNIVVEGVFLTANRASGTLEGTLSLGEGTCRLDGVTWEASRS